MRFVKGALIFSGNVLSGWSTFCVQVSDVAVLVALCSWFVLSSLERGSASLPQDRQDGSD